MEQLLCILILQSRHLHRVYHWSLLLVLAGQYVCQAASSKHYEAIRKVRCSPATSSRTLRAGTWYTNELSISIKTQPCSGLYMHQSALQVCRKVYRVCCFTTEQSSLRQKPAKWHLPETNIDWGLHCVGPVGVLQSGTAARQKTVGAVPTQCTPSCCSCRRSWLRRTWCGKQLR